MEKPEKREGFRHPDLLVDVLKNRLRLLSAALRIVRAYVLASKPDMKLKPWASYESWSSVIRNAITWNDLPDPGEARHMVLAHADTTETSMRSLLAVLEMIDPERFGLTAAEIIGRPFSEFPTDPSDVVQMLRDAIDNLVVKSEARLQVP